MARLTILIGPICSGKSTFSRKRAANREIIVNDDSIVMAVHAGNYLLYGKDLKRFYKSIESHIIYSALMMGLPTLVDRPCFKAATRARYIQIAKSLDCRVEGVIFPREAPEVHAERRFNSDSRGLSLEWWLKTARYHDSLWEEPKLTEGFDSLAHVADIKDD